MFDVTYHALALAMLFALLLWGAHAGFRRWRWRGVRARLGEKDRARRLGYFITDSEEVASAAKAYLDQGQALGALCSYPWDVQVSPVPFVGYAPTAARDRFLHVNSRHFRSCREIGAKKPEKTVRVFLVGGSTAFGVACPDDTTIGVLLEKALAERLARSDQNVEVVTAACPSWSSTHERILTENVLSGLDPDVVVCFSGFNDVHWAWNRRDVLWFRSYADEHFRELMNAALDMSGFDPFPADGVELDQVPSPERVAWTLRRNHLLGASALAHCGCRAKSVFVLQPSMPESKKEFSGRERQRFSLWHPDQVTYYQDCYEKMRRMFVGTDCDDRSVKFLDYSGIFDSTSSDDELFIDGSHFGDKGNQIVAQRLAKDLFEICF